MAESEVVKKNDSAPAGTALSPETEVTYVPDVDISEDNERILLMVDMPGADQQSIDVTVENDVLTIEGQASTTPPEGYTLVGQEYGVGKFRRDFDISQAVDSEGIKARMKNGVLQVTIPKRDEAKTKRIKIEA